MESGAARVDAEAARGGSSRAAPGLQRELEMVARVAQEAKERQKIRALHRDLATMPEAIQLKDHRILEMTPVPTMT